MIYTVIYDEDKEFKEVCEKIDKFDKDNIVGGLRKLYIGSIDEFDIYTVNGDYVKLKFKPKMEFVEAGNGYRYEFIPKNDRNGCEIWLDDNLHSDDYPPNILHEMIESRRMRDFEEEYEVAHNHAQDDEYNYRIIRLERRY